MLPIMNSILEGNPPPPEFITSIIVTVPKKSNSTSLNNQCGLSLMSVNAKLFNRIMLGRLRDRMETLLWNLQAGFRPYRNTTEQILCVKLCIDACRSRKKSLVAIFSDYSKAFDYAVRACVPVVLEFYGVPTQIIDAIMSLYTNTEAYVRTSSGDTDRFGTTSGVLQGDTLAPYLFIIVLDYVLRISLCEDSDGYTVRRRLSSRNLAVKLPGLAFADDAVLMSDTVDAAQRQFRRFERASSQVGLRINPQKTEVMYVGVDPTTPILTLSGDPLPTCTEFCYMGCNISNSRSALQRRRHLAWVSCRKLDIVWTCSASDHLKVKLFVACIESVLFYSGASWTLTETLEKTIDASHRALLRYALNVRYPKRITSAELYCQSKVTPASTTLRKQRLQLIGHATRRDIPLSLLLDKNNQPTEPYRRGGALMRTYQQQLSDDLRMVGIGLNQLHQATQNAEQWKRTINKL